MLTEEDKQWISEQLEKRVTRIEKYLWADGKPNPEREREINESIGRIKAMMEKAKERHPNT